MRGCFAYHAVPTTAASLAAFLYDVKRAWRWMLRRRSQNHRMTGAKLGKPAARWLPKARILHPWPSQRFDVRHPRQAPVGFAAHAGICARGAG